MSTVMRKSDTHLSQERKKDMTNNKFFDNKWYANVNLPKPTYTRK